MFFLNWDREAEKIDEVKYRAILNENIFNSVSDLGVGTGFSFQHDNNPKHTARDAI